MVILIFLILLISCNTEIIDAQSQIESEQIRSEKEEFKLSVIADNLNYPWSVAFLPDDEGFLITEKTGKLILYKNNKKITITGLPEITPYKQGGLLDVVTDPDFKTNRMIYLSFTFKEKDGLKTAVARGKLSGNSLIDLKIIFKAVPGSSSGHHFGSRMVIGPEGFIYITIGDRGIMENAQDLKKHSGKVLRIKTDGSIPEDNPYRNDSEALDEIFSYGHRNAQGMIFDRERNILWLHEHGPKGGDELNIVRKGENYGWPVITYGIGYDGKAISDLTEKEGMMQPETYWVPSIAPSGLSVYYKDQFPAWKGNLFAGALKGKHLRRIVYDDISGKVIHQEILLKNKIGRIRDVRTSENGEIYILTDSKNGKLYRISK